MEAALIPNPLATASTPIQTMGVFKLGSLGARVGSTVVGVTSTVESAKSPMIWPKRRFPPRLPASDYESADPVASFHTTI